MSKNKRKYYVVWKGKKPGVYNTWGECKEQIDGIAGAKFKSYFSLTVAKEAFDKGYNHIPKPGENLAIHLEGLEQNLPKPVMPSIAVDAAWNTATGDMEYQGVDTETANALFRKGPYPDGTNNVGEFLALVHGIALLKQKGSTLPIYTDSLTAISWVRKKKAKTELAQTDRNAELFNLIERAEKWLKTNTWKNPLLKWETQIWGEIPADFGRK